MMNTAFRTAVFAAALLCASCSTFQTPPDRLSAKERLAEELMEIVPPETMFSQLSWAYANTYAPIQRQAQAHTNFMRNVDVSELNRIIRVGLVEHFSEEDLKALVGFYSSPEGRACMAKVAAFAADIVPACSHEATKAFRKTATDAARNMLLP